MQNLLLTVNDNNPFSDDLRWWFVAVDGDALLEACHQLCSRLFTDPVVGQRACLRESGVQVESLRVECPVPCLWLGSLLHGEEVVEDGEPEDEDDYVHIDLMRPGENSGFGRLISEVSPEKIKLQTDAGEDPHTVLLEFSPWYAGISCRLVACPKDCEDGEMHYSHSFLLSELEAVLPRVRLRGFTKKQKA